MENTSRMTAVAMCGAIFLGLLVALQLLSGSPQAQAAPGGQPKVNVCHYDADTNTYVKITVGQPAVPAHLNHGDTLSGEESTEICDGKDNDCNGSTDEGLGQTSCGVGACAVTVDACVGGVPQACTPGLPAGDDDDCDGIDDDCDGSVDEDYASQPTICGTGVCRANGSTSCVNGVVVDSCIERTFSPETCDNLDNDCDGAVDEGLTLSCYNGPGGTNGVGVCQAGSQTCTAGVWGACTGQVLPAPEVCNATDDDCDGTADEDLVCSE